jgi:mercuric reductase
LRTTNPRIFAAGDVTLEPQFVYVAAYEGSVAAENALTGADREVDLTVVPGVVFTAPQIATVGLTRRQAEARGEDVDVTCVPLALVHRAVVNHETDGVFVLVANARTRRILGAQIVAANAGEAIYAATLAVRHGLTVEDLVGGFAPYLTMAEGLRLAAVAFDRDPAKLSCCA